jgi:hypothetical protein
LNVAGEAETDTDWARLAVVETVRSARASEHAVRIA